MTRIEAHKLIGPYLTARRTLAIPNASQARDAVAGYRALAKTSSLPLHETREADRIEAEIPTLPGGHVHYLTPRPW